MRNCKMCEKEIPNYRSFCSRSCAAKYQHEYTDLNNRIKIGKEKTRSPGETRHCLNCNECFIVPVNSPRKFCTWDCSYKYNGTRFIRSPESLAKANITRTGKPHPHKSTGLGRKKPSLSITRKRMFKNGELKIWCDGLTKETDIRIAKYAKKVSLSHIGIPISHNLRGYGKAGFREDIGHFVRSTWEANFARILNYNNVKYEYEKHRFMLEDCSYCPDFYLPQLNIYIEVKGYLREEGKLILRKFVEKYPNEKTFILDGGGYKKLSSIYSNNIINWESSKSFV